MPVTLVCVHGRGCKPPQQELQALWQRALGTALKRFDAPRARACAVELVYYGDLLNTTLAERGEHYDAALDSADRHVALAALRALKRKQFASRGDYERLPGQRAWPELLADAGVGLLRTLRLADHVFERLVPDISRYQRDPAWGAQLRERLVRVLQRRFEQGDSVVLVSHCLGSIVAWDVLWELSAGQYSWYAGSKISGWLTLGSPLGDETVKRRLAGSAEPAQRRYPGNVLRWVNVSGEDDWIAHDNRVADDYRDMLRQRLISRIDDVTILNHTVRYGRSNPHSSLGYLYHPRVAGLLEELVLAAAPDGDGGDVLDEPGDNARQDPQS